MRISLAKTSEFEKEVKRLQRKYRHIEDDLQEFFPSFLENPLQGSFPIPSFKRKLWKARVRSTDLQRGKSGGFRLIFYFDETKPETVHLLKIYPKTEREDVSSSELWELYKRFIQAFLKPQK